MFKNNLHLNYLKVLLILKRFYLLFILIISLLLVVLIKPSPWLSCFNVLMLLFVPGLSLAELLKIRYPKDLLGNIVLSLSLGLLIVLTLSLLGILLGINVLFLEKIYLLLVIVIATVNSFKYLLNNESALATKKDLKLISYQHIILYFLAFCVLAMVLLAISYNGALMKGGDPAFHLSVIRRAFDGAALSPGNLSFVKDNVHIAYGFPIWHVAVALFAHILNVDIFVIYNHIIMSMTVFMILTWSWLFKQIFKNIAVTVISIIILMLYNFIYPFTVLVLPDALSQYLLLPLIIAISLKYIFEEKSSWKIVVIVAYFLLLMAAIHVTQYFYFLLLMILLLFVTSLFTCFKDREVYRKIWQLILAHLSVLFLAILFIFIKNKSGLDVLKGYMSDQNPEKIRYNHISKFSILSKFAYLAAPLAIFFKKNKQFYLLITVFMMVPVFYWQPIRNILQKFLGYIFVNRLYANFNWYYVMIALVFSFLLVFIDRLVENRSRLFKIILNSLLFISLAILIWLQIKLGTVLSAYQLVFSPKTSNWLNEYYLLILGVWTLLIIIYFIFVAKKGKLSNMFEFKEKKPSITFILFGALICFFIFTSRLKAINIAFNEEEILKKRFNYEEIANYAGGSKIIDYIRNNIGPKSVFLTNGQEVYIEMLTDQQASAYPHSADEKYYSQFFNKNTSPDERIKILKKGKIDYILLNKSKMEWLDTNTHYFEKIYDDGSVLYRVKKNLFN